MNRTPTRASGLTVVVAGTPYDGMPMSEWHLANRLAERGPVLWVDPPRSAIHETRARLAGAGPTVRLRRVNDGLTRLTTVTPPGPTRPGLRSAVRLVVRRAARRAADELGAEVQGVVVACLDDLSDVWPAARRLFYVTDDFLAGAGLMGISERHARRSMCRQLSKADVVVAVSDVLAGSLQTQFGVERVEVVENGCDVDLLAGSASEPLPPDVDLPGPVAGFAGHLTDRIDLACLQSVVQAGMSLLLVGPCHPMRDGARFEALLRHPRVEAVGERPFRSMPSYFGAMDVGLTPYTLTAFNQASFPLKTLDYLAAGLPVVSTDLAGSRSLRTDEVVIARPEGFGAAARRLAEQSRQPVLVRQRQAVAGAFSWDWRAAQVADLLSAAAPAGPR